MFLDYLSKFYVEMPIQSFTQDISLRGVVGTCQTPMYLLFVYKNYYYYVRTSVLFKIHAANIEASKIVVVFVGDGKLFLKISRMLVVCICNCYMFHIFLSFASESGVARNTILLLWDWQDLMMVQCSAVMKEEDL